MAKYNTEMSEEQWKKFGEIQYLKGRLDELFKLDAELMGLDLHDMRILDARITKYLDKLASVDAMAYQLYHIERENIKHSIQRSIRDERNKKSGEAS
jgi:hypothetical protein